jgi:UDP-xylose/UDP-N-acetylglucosamine transporter B4
MEYVLKGDPKAGNLLSLTEILFVLLQSLPGRFAGFRPKALVAPLISHLQFTLLWSTMSILANYAFSYKISVTIFTLVRSCNLIATVLLGRLFFGCRYNWMQIICVLSVSMGIFMASMGEAKTISSPSSSCTDCSNAPPPQSAAARGEAQDSLSVWAVGIAMLAFVQLLQGVLGHVQSGFYKRYADLAPRGELCDEYLFTSQIVALVPLMLMREDLGAAISSAINSESALLVPAPSRVVWLLLNCIANAVCLKGVFRTSSIVSPLALTIILSVRKFLSIIVSIVWFKNPWTALHSVAVVLIFGGAFAYSQAPEGVRDKAEKED